MIYDKEYESFLKKKCAKCKKKPWVVGIQYGKKVKRTVLLCDDCAFPNVKVKK